jgi:hypothetical protein
MRQYGNELIVFAPWRWNFIQTLELTPATQRGGDAQPPAWAEGDKRRESFVGTADGVPVFGSDELPDSKLVVLALDAFVRWRQWKVEDGHEVRVSITGYDDDEARALAEENPDLFRAAERTTVEARARELRKAVLINVDEVFATEILDAEAARRIAIPAEF